MSRSQDNNRDLGHAPPMASTFLPVIGPIQKFGSDPLGFLRWCRAKYGNIFTLNFLLYKMTFLLGEEEQRAFFNAAEEDLNFNDAVNQLISGALGPQMYADKSAHVDLDYKMIRKGLSKESAIENYMEDVTKEAQETFQSWERSGEIDLFPMISDLTTNINIRAFFGESARRRYGTVLCNALHSVEQDGTAPLAVAFPSFPSPSVLAARAARAQIKKVIAELMDERRRMSPSEREQHRDYLQVILNNNDEAKGMSLDKITRHLIGMLFAAHANTAGVMAWTLLHMLQHPQVYREVQAELDELSMRKDGRLDLTAIRNLERLDCCMKESMRLTFTVVILRKAARPYQIGGYTIPKDHLICISPVILHNDGTIFPSPERYMPERWTDDALRRDLMNRHVFVQFGYGRHRCMGELLANSVLRICWTQLLRHYTLDLVSPAPVPNWSKALGMPYAKGVAKVQLKRRPASKVFNWAFAPGKNTWA